MDSEVGNRRDSRERECKCMFTSFSCNPLHIYSGANPTDFSENWF